MCFLTLLHPFKKLCNCWKNFYKSSGAFTFRYWFTRSESITSSAFGTVTNRNMIGNWANSGKATSSRAWILTFVSDTRFTHNTVRTDQAFRSAAFIRIALIFWKTCASSDTVFRTTSSIWTTWRRITWVYRTRRSRLYYNDQQMWYISQCNISVFVKKANMRRSLTNSSKHKYFTFIIDRYLPTYHTLLRK